MPADLPQFSERYRLYVDESGDHVFNKLDVCAHRYLCLLCCYFKNSDYVEFHNDCCQTKFKHFDCDADNLFAFHREDMVRTRGPFAALQNPDKRSAFDDDLIKIIQAAKFSVFGIVIDKKALQAKYPSPIHPYHLAMSFTLQRYCRFLKTNGTTGDVLAEGRGGKEDLHLKNAYRSVYDAGIWQEPASLFQSTLSSRDLKIKQKAQNIAGLQLCDMLGNPVKHHILLRHSRTKQPLSGFDKRLTGTLSPKYHKHIYRGKIQDSGHLLWPLK